MTLYHYETLQGYSLNKWDYNDKPINANSILFALLPAVEIHKHPKINVPDCENSNNYSKIFRKIFENGPGNNSRIIFGGSRLRSKRM